MSYLTASFSNSTLNRATLSINPYSLSFVTLPSLNRSASALLRSVVTAFVQLSIMAYESGALFRSQIEDGYNSSVSSSDDALPLALPEFVPFGLLSPATDEDRVLVTPFTAPTLGVIELSPSDYGFTSLSFDIVLVEGDKVEFDYNNSTYRATLDRECNLLSFKRCSVSLKSKRFMNIKYPAMAFGEDYSTVANACFAALGL